MSQSFLDEFIKRAQMAMDPNMAMGAPPMGAPPMGGGMPPMGGGMPPMDPMAMMGGGAPPMDPAAMGGAPPMDPAAMGGQPSPEDIMALMSQLQGGGAPAPEMGGEPGAEEPMVPAELAQKAMEVADSALELAQARGEDDLDALSTNAAGPMVASGAIDNLTPEEIMAMKGMQA